MLPNVSVVIPVHNTEKYLTQCIESVLKQIEKNDEIVLINDGSTDGCGVICETYANVNENIIYLRQNNIGLGGTRNKGIRIASKEYIVFLDSDDYWEAGALQTLKETLSNHTLDIAYFDAKCVSEDTAYLQYVLLGNKRYNREGLVSEEVSSGENYFKRVYPLYFTVQSCMAVYRRAFLIEHAVCFQEKVYYEDNLFSFKAVLEAEKVKYISQQLYVRRYRFDSIMTSKITLKKLKDHVEVLNEICRYILNLKNKFSGALLWKMYYFAYKILDNFISDSRKYTGDRNDYIELEKLIYNKVFLLTEQDDSDYGIALGKFLKALEYVMSQHYGESLIGEVFSGDRGDKSSLEFVYDLYLKKYRGSVDRKLKMLPIFDQNVRVGIYGTGGYTEHLLKECNILGNITDSLLIINSCKKEERQYLGRFPIVNIKDIGQRVDKIVISSYKYEAEILKMVHEYTDENVEIILLHEDEIGPIFWEFVCREEQK